MKEKYDAYYDKEHDYSNKKICIDEFDWPRTEKERKVLSKRVAEEFEFADWIPKYRIMNEKLKEDGKDRDYLNIDKDIASFGQPRTKEENRIYLFRYMKERVKNWKYMDLVKYDMSDEDKRNIEFDQLHTDNWD